MARTYVQSGPGALVHRAVKTGSSAFVTKCAVTVLKSARYVAVTYPKGLPVCHVGHLCKLCFEEYFR